MVVVVHYGWVWALLLFVGVYYWHRMLALLSLCCVRDVVLWPLMVVGWLVGWGGCWLMLGALLRVCW